MWAIIITGASKGLGRSIATSLAKGLQAHGTTATFVLVARSASGLKDTADLIDAAHVKQTVEADLSSISTLTDTIDAIVAKLDLSEGKYEKVVLINNAGTLGDITSKVKDYKPDPKEQEAFFNLNLTSCFNLTSRVIKESERTNTSCVVVNISSLLAVKSFAGFGLYCASKHARDSFHTVIAQEEDPARVKTLNYAPGPLDTEMQRDIREGLVDETLRKNFADMFEQGKLVDPNASADKLTNLLIKNEFESGKHIDFFEI